LREVSHKLGGKGGLLVHSDPNYAALVEWSLEGKKEERNRRGKNLKKEKRFWGGG